MFKTPHSDESALSRRGETPQQTCKAVRLLFARLRVVPGEVRTERGDGSNLVSKKVLGWEVVPSPREGDKVVKGDIQGDLGFSFNGKLIFPGRTRSKKVNDCATAMDYGNRDYWNTAFFAGWPRRNLRQANTRF